MLAPTDDQSTPSLPTYVELDIHAAVDALGLVRRRDSLRDVLAALAARGIVLARRVTVLLLLVAGVSGAQCLPPRTPTPTVVGGGE
jgi:hypothetical protein